MKLLKAVSALGERRRSSSAQGEISADGASPAVGYIILITLLVKMVSPAIHLCNMKMLLCIHIQCKINNLYVQMP